MNGHLDEETIQLFLDGMLSARARERAEEHLVTCATCRAELARWGQLFAALDALAPVPAVEDSSLVSTVLARTGLFPGPPDRRLGPWPVVQGVVALGLLVWLWSDLVNWTQGAPGWLGEQITGLASWLELLWASIAGWAAWLEEEMFSLVPGWQPALPADVSWLHLGLLMGALFVVWLWGNRFLLRNGSLRQP